MNSADRISPYPEAVTTEQLQAVEQQVNAWILADLPVTKQTLPKQEALDAGAIAFFREKYPETVTVYTIGTDVNSDWISKEFCGGPHVEKTSQIGTLEVYKEKSVGAGVRRIYARSIA